MANKPDLNKLRTEIDSRKREKGTLVENAQGVQMPAKDEKVKGGHAVLIVGYDDTIKRFLCMNSWGILWGMRGYFTIPYEYVLNPSLAGDFWVLTNVENP